MAEDHNIGVRPDEVSACTATNNTNDESSEKEEASVNHKKVTIHVKPVPDAPVLHIIGEVYHETLSSGDGLSALVTGMSPLVGTEDQPVAFDFHSAAIRDVDYDVSNGAGPLYLHFEGLHGSPEVRRRAFWGPFFVWRARW